MKPYAGIDFYRFAGQLTDEERSAQQTVREFVTASFLPLIRAHHAAGTFPTELIGELGAMGLLGPSVSGPGCPGLSATVYGLICQELERGDSGLRSFASVQGSLVMCPISVFGSDEQRTKFLPGLAAGKLVGCYGLTEPDHGSDPGAMETTAVKDGTDWILTGNKMWITNATTADVALVWARGPERILGFLVERGHPVSAPRPPKGSTVYAPPTPAS